MDRDSKDGQQETQTQAAEVGDSQTQVVRSLLLPREPRQFKLQEIDIGEGRTCVVRLAEPRDRLTLLLAAGYGTGKYCDIRHKALVLAWGVVTVKHTEGKPLLGSDGKELQGLIVDGLGHVFFDTLFDTIDSSVIEGMYQRIWCTLDMHPALGIWPSLMALVQNVVDDVCGNAPGTLKAQMKNPISMQA